MTTSVVFKNYENSIVSLINRYAVADAITTANIGSRRGAIKEILAKTAPWRKTRGKRDTEEVEAQPIENHRLTSAEK